MSKPADPKLLPALHVTRRFAAPRERVFRAFTDPTEIPHWFGHEGDPLPVAELDLRQGGRFVFRGTHRGDEWEVKGVYRDVRIPERVVFTWMETMAGGPSSAESLVTVEFREVAGATEVALTHERDVDEKQRKGHEEGWTICFDRMEKWIEKTRRKA
jgi:uncharacterized protein YndB with AHSA1/START domain